MKFRIFLIVIAATLAVVTCTNTSAPLLPDIWAADIAIREGDGETFTGTIQASYCVDHQLLRFSFAMPGGVNAADFVAYLNKDVIGIDDHQGPPGVYQCTRTADYHWPMNREVLQHALYVGQDRLVDVYRMPFADLESDIETIEFRTVAGTYTIVEITLFAMKGQEDQKDVHITLTGHRDEIDEYFLDMNARCPVIRTMDH